MGTESLSQGVITPGAAQKSRWERSGRKRSAVSVRIPLFRESGRKGDPLEESEILLVEDLDEGKRAEWRALGEAVGRCAVPGGCMKDEIDWGEPARAASREAEEETGFIIAPSELWPEYVEIKNNSHRQEWYPIRLRMLKEGHLNGANPRVNVRGSISKEPRAVDGILEVGVPEWWTLREFFLSKKEGRTVEGKHVITHFSHREAMVHVLWSLYKNHGENSLYHRQLVALSMLPILVEEEDEETRRRVVIQEGIAPRIQEVAARYVYRSEKQEKSEGEEGAL